MNFLPISLLFFFLLISFVCSLHGVRISPYGHIHEWRLLQALSNSQRLSLHDSSLFTLQILLKTQQPELIETLLLQVSNPLHSSYTRYLSLSELKSLSFPDSKQFEILENYFLSGN
jgi:subtilase family serine protease